MSDLFDDPYAVLGVSRSATDEEIKKAYKRCALRNHPDKSPPELKNEAEVKFRAVSEAYEILKDPEMRQRYDAFGMNGLRGGNSQQNTRNDFSGPNFQHGVFFHDPRSIFEQYFGRQDPFNDPFFATPMFHDPFGAYTRHQHFRHHQSRTSNQNSQFPQQSPHFQQQFNHPFFSPFPSMPHAFPTMSMSPMFDESFSAGFSSNSFSSQDEGFSGGFSSRSIQTQIINGERTTVTTITDQNGTRVETVVVGRDGREKKREVIENGRVIQSLQANNGGRMVEGSRNNPP